MRPTVARCAIVKDNFSTEQVTKIYENSWEFTDIYVTNGVQVNITYGPNQRVVQTLDSSKTTLHADTHVECTEVETDTHLLTCPGHTLLGSMLLIYQKLTETLT